MQTLQPHYILAQHPLFAQLKPDDLATLAAAAQLETFSHGATLPLHSEEPFLWIVAWGSVQRRVPGAAVVQTLAAGDLLASVSTVSGASARALSPLALLRLPAGLLQHVGVDAGARARGHTLRPTVGHSALPSGQLRRLLRPWAYAAGTLYGLSTHVPALLAAPIIDNVWGTQEFHLLPAMAVVLLLAAVVQTATGTFCEPLLRAGMPLRGHRGGLRRLLHAQATDVARTGFVAATALGLVLIIAPCAVLPSVGMALLLAPWCLRGSRQLERGAAAMQQMRHLWMAHLAEVGRAMRGALPQTTRATLQLWGERRLQRLLRQMLRSTAQLNRWRLGAQALQTLHLLSVVLLGTHLLRIGKVTLGQWATAVWLTDTLWRSGVACAHAYLQSLSRSERRKAPRRRTAFAQIRQWLSRGRPRRVQPTPANTAANLGQGRTLLSCEHVALDRSRQSPVLTDVHVEVGAGERVGLLGRSGAGKTALARICAGELAVTHGVVRLGNRLVTHLSARQRRQQIAWVHGESLHGMPRAAPPNTLHDMIAGAGLVADRDMVEAAAAWVCLHDSIAALPQTYDTPVTAVHFSRSQWLQLRLAQGLIHKPRLLILDAVLSQLPDPLAHAIESNIARHLPSCGWLVMSQHVGALQRMDRIYVLDAGRICETGRPATLAQAGGLYQYLAAGI